MRAMDGYLGHGFLRFISINPVALLRRWYTVARQRRDLYDLDDATLRDIGLRREDVLQEAAKPFWR